MKRRFSKNERSALYIASDGHCSLCGELLPIGWHADHIQPFSKGGQTDVTDGQSLCAKCNLSKGNKMIRLPAWPAHIELRKCQQQAYTAFIEKAKSTFLADLTPGAGKTIFGARVAHAGLSDGSYEQIIIACPTKLLKVQWANKLHLFGIEGNPYYESGDLLSSGYHGAVVTYSQVAADASLFRLLCNRRKTLVILDEPHHCGVPKSWGDAVEYAFDHAVSRLMVTGTAWRTDASKMPFIEYTSDGYGIADYTYGYKDAMRDGICRYVVFPTYEGTMEWVSGQTGDIHEASFDALLNARQTAERLKTALQPSGDFMQKMIRDAHTQLMKCRTMGHPDAGGLIVCIDIVHAITLAEEVRKITGCTPMVVTSDTEEADAKIEQFAKSNQEWIVAVKMVSEGVDIPRLRVGIYATNVTTQLFFTQFVGRFVRWINGLPEQTAYVYIPEDPRIAECAFNIAMERRHAIEEAAQEDADEPDDEYDDPRTGETVSFFWPIRAEGEHNGAIVDSSKISSDELNASRDLAERFGVAPEIVARMRRVWEQDNSSKPPSQYQSHDESSRPSYKEAGRLKKTIKTLSSVYAQMVGWEVKDVHILWMQNGGKAHKLSDLTDLKTKEQWLRDMIDQENKRRAKPTS
jgi:superfamily II DNA or RNA helicase